MKKVNFVKKKKKVCPYLKIKKTEEGNGAKLKILDTCGFSGFGNEHINITNSPTKNLKLNSF